MTKRGRRVAWMLAVAVGTVGCAAEHDLPDASERPERAPALQVAPVRASVLDEIEVERVVARGGACASGTVNVFTGRSGVQLFFTELKVARSDAERVARATSASCGVRVALRAVPGVSYALGGLRVLGSSYLPAGARASYRVQHAFAGASVTAVARSETWQGPSLGNWQHAWDEVRSPWSRCGESAELSLEVPITVESAGLAVVEVSNLIFAIDHTACTP